MFVHLPGNAAPIRQRGAARFLSPQHSRLRELMLGGVIREMLAAMIVPVFMSH